MDTTINNIKMCEKATEIQDINRMWKRKEQPKPFDEGDYELILDNMSFYGVHVDKDYFYLPNFAHYYVWNHPVCGYVLRPQDIQGCAVRSDLPLAYTSKQIIWLPRQDELQKIVDYNDIFDLANEIDRDWLDSGYGGAGVVVPKEYRTLKTMEQFWLAFVMKEKFNKRWDGNDWVKI